MPKLVRDASELRGGRRISFGDIRAAQTRYIARGCPLLDVIGRSLTSMVDGKFIGRLLPSSERVYCRHKLGRNEEYGVPYGACVLSLNMLRDAKASIRMTLYPAV